MKAMILAAGLGTRLRPFTDSHPKALFKVGGKTLLEIAIEHLRDAGVEEIIVNVHHFADQIVEYLHLNKDFNLKISLSDETGELLETGGGMKKASWFFRDTDCAIVRNVDILSDLDLRRMAGFHLEKKALATLAIRDRETSRYLLFDDLMHLRGWENTKTGVRIITGDLGGLRPFAFSGIQVLDPKIFGLITEEGRFSLTDLYLRLSANHMIAGYIEDGVLWKDVGRMPDAG